MSGLRCATCDASLREGASECRNGHKQNAQCQSASLTIAIAEGAKQIIERPREKPLNEWTK